MSRPQDRQLSSRPASRGLAALALTVILLLAAAPAGADDRPPPTPAGLDAELRAELVASVGRGLDFLTQRQKSDGSWEHDIGITGLAVTAFLEAPGGVAPEHRPRLDRALAFIADKAREDGGIYLRDLPNYYTAVALQALVTAGKPEHGALIARAQRFLVGLQADEGKGYTEGDKFYGGIGYGSDLRPDLANMEYALGALKASALPADHPLWEKALEFVQRTQNRSESNDQAWAGDDGGFVYYPGFSYAEGTRSYGSMTYAGLLSYSYAEVGRDDPRVQSALEWIRANYTVDENPGLGAKALYYYYLVFAKALAALGEPVIVDDEGIAHDWRRDLGRKLLAEQHDDGHWVNEDPAWWQDNPVLVTAFSVQALNHVLRR